MKKILCILSLFLAFNILAEETKKMPLRFSLGYAGLIKTNNRFDNQYEKGKKDPIILGIPFPFLMYGPLHIGSNGISLSFIGDKDVSSFININRAGERYYGINMDQRKDSVFMGLGLKYYKYNFILNKDINGRSKGLKMNLSFSEMAIIDELQNLRYGVSIEYYNKNYSKYYYGVKDNEVSTSRSAYSPRGYFIPAFNTLYTYKFYEKFSGTVVLSAKKLSAEITNSPTTNGKEYELTSIFGISYIIF